MVKLNDVRKEFIENGHYEICVSLDSVIQTLNKYENDFALDLNPDFQRDYVWTESQQIAYVEFLLKGGLTSRTIYFNMKGWMTDFSGQMVILDGKQRLNSIVKFLKNELKVFGYYLDDFEDKDRILRHYELRFNINDMSNRKDILQWYIDYNTGGTVHSEEEINRVKLLLKNELNK